MGDADIWSVGDEGVEKRRDAASEGEAAEALTVESTFEIDLVGDGVEDKYKMEVEGNKVAMISGGDELVASDDG